MIYSPNHSFKLINFFICLESSLKEEVERSLQLPPTYETLVSRAKLAMVSLLQLKLPKLDKSQKYSYIILEKLLNWCTVQSCRTFLKRSCEISMALS